MEGRRFEQHDVAHLYRVCPACGRGTPVVSPSSNRADGRYTFEIKKKRVKTDNTTTSNTNKSIASRTTKVERFLAILNLFAVVLFCFAYRIVDCVVLAVV